MKTHVKALVVGGGAVGTSIAYHLARAGWDDVMLLERDELTSGSTWHAAGLLPLFNMSFATTHIHQYSVEFYKTLEAETGLNAGFSIVGNLRMAQTQARMDEYMVYATTAETCGVPYEWLRPAQIKERYPLVRTEDLVGAIYHPTDGAKWYVREERGGWILGPYERNAPARFEYAVPDSFRADLFQLDLERIEEEYMSMIHRIPSSETVGLKDDYNGPICYTPDGNPLVGPAPGLRNMWIAEGFSFGITAAGGTGYYLAQMMVEGEAEIDMASLDPKRYGDWMTTEYAARKNEECYEHVYILHHPDEEREACRPLRTAPAYDRQKALGAQFGCVNGFERPNYFGPLDANDNFDHEARSFRRGGWWQYAVDEAKAIREGVGLIDATAFTKHIVKGPGATAF
ncbi:MAG: FAD-dependent oxidoreductase, partial [Rhodobacteraceae bacterium]|nr:FAD-dependent oxidoreductase [Paracoccaceae bacterium]